MSLQLVEEEEQLQKIFKKKKEQRKFLIGEERYRSCNSAEKEIECTLKQNEVLLFKLDKVKKQNRYY